MSLYLEIESLESHSHGRASWRAIATTNDGRIFVKLPHVDPTTGHDGAWKEYISLLLARQAGLPFPMPRAVHVHPDLISARAPSIFWGHGERFCGTAWLELQESSVDTLSRSQRALLFGIDNLLHNIDRAWPGAKRNDIWSTADGSIVLLDLDMVHLPANSDVLRPDYFAWFSPFLVRNFGFHTVQHALTSIANALTDSFLDTTVSNAADIWPRVDRSTVTSWIRARRDALPGEALKVERDRHSAAAWFVS